MAQRVMIAMALAAGPELLIADEPTTALDVTIQAQILDLMAHLRYELGMAMVLITHDLGVVAEMAERVAVMYAGQIVEETTTPALFRDAAAPVHARADRVGAGDRPAPGRAVGHPRAGAQPHRPPAGCRFAPRCEARVEAGLTRCMEEMPALVEVAPGHKVRCFLHSDVAETATPVAVSGVRR